LQLTFGQCKSWAGLIDCRWRSSGSQRFLVFQPPGSLSTRAIDNQLLCGVFSSTVAIQDVQDQIQEKLETRGEAEDERSGRSKEGREA
jgi:hypothetical protein